MNKKNNLKSLQNKCRLYYFNYVFNTVYMYFHFIFTNFKSSHLIGYTHSEAGIDKQCNKPEYHSTFFLRLVKVKVILRSPFCDLK